MTQVRHGPLKSFSVKRLFKSSRQTRNWKTKLLRYKQALHNLQGRNVNITWGKHRFDNGASIIANHLFSIIQTKLIEAKIKSLPKKFARSGLF